MKKKLLFLCLIHYLIVFSMSSSEYFNTDVVVFPMNSAHYFYLDPIVQSTMYTVTTEIEGEYKKTLHDEDSSNRVVLKAQLQAYVQYLRSKNRGKLLPLPELENKITHRFCTQIQDPLEILLSIQDIGEYAGMHELSMQRMFQESCKKFKKYDTEEHINSLVFPAACVVAQEMYKEYQEEKNALIEERDYATKLTVVTYKNSYNSDDSEVILDTDRKKKTLCLSKNVQKSVISYICAQKHGCLEAMFLLEDLENFLHINNAVVTNMLETIQEEYMKRFQNQFDS